MERLLSVTADLTIDINEHTALVRGDSSSVVVEAPSVSVAFEMVKVLGPLRRVRRRIACLAELLSRAGLSVTLCTPRRNLVTIGGNENSVLLRLIGVPHARLHFDRR